MDQSSNHLSSRFSSVAIWPLSCASFSGMPPSMILVASAKHITPLGKQNKEKEKAISSAVLLVLVHTGSGTSAVGVPTSADHYESSHWSWRRWQQHRGRGGCCDEAGAEKVATHTGSKWWWQHVTGRKKRQWLGKVERKRDVGGERERGKESKGKKKRQLSHRCMYQAVGLPPNAPIYTDQTVIKRASYINCTG